MRLSIGLKRMIKLILIVNSCCLFLIALCFLVFEKELRRINKHSPDVIIDVAFLMEPIDWHKYNAQHPKRLR